MYEQTSAQPTFWKMAIKSFIGKRFLPPTLIPRNSAAYFIRSSYGHENLPVHKTSEHLFVEPQLVGGRAQEGVAGRSVESLLFEEPAVERAIDDVEGDHEQVPQAVAERATVEFAMKGGAGDAAVRPDGAARIRIERTKHLVALAKA